MVYVCFSNLTEGFGAFAIEPQVDFPSFLTVASGCLRNMVTAEICFLSDEQAFFDRLSALNLLFVCLDAVFRRNHFLAVINRFQAFTIVRINEAKLYLGYT